MEQRKIKPDKVDRKCEWDGELMLRCYLKQRPNQVRGQVCRIWGKGERTEDARFIVTAVVLTIIHFALHSQRIFNNIWRVFFYFHDRMKRTYLWFG